MYIISIAYILVKFLKMENSCLQAHLTVCQSYSMEQYFLNVFTSGALWTKFILKSLWDLGSPETFVVPCAMHTIDKTPHRLSLSFQLFAVSLIYLFLFLNNLLIKSGCSWMHMETLTQTGFR